MERITENRDYDSAALQKCLRRLCGEYGFLRAFPVGQSCAGREITALKLGTADEYVLFTAAFHGSEHITVNILLRFMEDMCAAVRDDGEMAGMNVRKALFGRGVIFVPCVNPDGCEIALHGAAGCGALGSVINRLCRGDFAHWNANLRGVDLNHNFDADWEKLRARERRAGIFGPSPSRFGGFRPESEPETLALTELCRTSRIRHVVALHTQGEVIYWSYGERKPPRSESMAGIMATASGYALDVPVGLAEGGGFKDWFISEFGRPGFTVELGRGENPLPVCETDGIYERVREMLLLAAIM